MIELSVLLYFVSLFACGVVGLIIGLYAAKYQSRRSNCIVINLQGTIAAGKSTQMNLLRKRYENDSTVAFVDEPLDLWVQHGLLEAYYKTQNSLKLFTGVGFHNSFFPATFQLVALITRARLFVEAIKPPHIKLVFAERSMHADLHVFANANLEGDANKAAYQLVYDSLQALIPSTCHHHFFLHIDTANAMSRIRTRGRKGEDLIDLKYMQDLDDGHTKMAKAYESETHTFDATQDPNALHDEIVAHVEDLRRSLHSF